MKGLITLLLGLFWVIAEGQTVDNVILKGNYTHNDSIHITKSYINSRNAVKHMYNAMNTIWTTENIAGNSKKTQREERWKANDDFMLWLGNPSNMRKARRKINKIHSKFQNKFILEMVNGDKGRCGRFVSAWSVPSGKVKIRLCQNFMNFGPQNQAKTIIHEIAHEAGLLFDRGVYRCKSAMSVAANTKNNRASRRPENYAWLAMSYVGMECNSSKYVSPLSY